MSGEQQAQRIPTQCQNCSGTGTAGRVTHEMALDAGDAQLEGQPVSCWFCDGTGISKEETP